jgi:hypothetical protein
MLRRDFDTFFFGTAILHSLACGHGRRHDSGATTNYLNT